MLTCLLIATACFAAEPQPLLVFDLEKHLSDLPEDSSLRYDTVKWVASLQGLVNRQQPRLLVRFLNGNRQDGQAINLDDYWLDKLQTTWLKDRLVERTADLNVLLDRFSEARQGVVLWDEAVPATANVAATVCGVEGWLPVRAAGELYRLLVENGPKLPVKLSLVGRFDGSESGSRKCDAYLWAKREYLDSGRCNPRFLAYYLDGYTHDPTKPDVVYNDLFNACLTNADYYIAEKAFFLDLSPWADETPIDDPQQPLGTDKKTLIAILRSAAEQNKGQVITSVGGFIPWHLKYTDHPYSKGKHSAVPTEWEYAAILSAHNAIMDADALTISCLTNASAFCHYPLAPRYKQNPKPAPAPLEPKTYVLIYMGDYDSAAWLSRAIPDVWDDLVRGSLPMAWAFNPNLADRVPYVFDYVYQTKTANDWFIGGDSGAGYLNPNLLTGDRLGSGLPDALELWVTHNKAYYERFDYSITGFVINGFHGDMPRRVQEAYAQFSPDGVGMQLGYEAPVVNGTPFLRHVSDVYPDPAHPEAAVDYIASCAKPDKPQFLLFRTVLHKPGTIQALRDGLQQRHPQHEWQFCDPYTFFQLYKRSLERN